MNNEEPLSGMITLIIVIILITLVFYGIFGLVKIARGIETRYDERGVYNTTYL